MRAHPRANAGREENSGGFQRCPSQNTTGAKLRVNLGCMKTTKCKIGQNTVLLGNNGVGPGDRFVWVPAGQFVMGSPTNEVDRYDNECPRTAVTISRGFWMGNYQVTQGEYLAVVGDNPSFCSTNNGYAEDLSRPVERVSWQDATNYCARLTARERSAGRLPAGVAY